MDFEEFKKKLNVNGDEFVPTPIQDLFLKLVEMKKCIWCDKEFEYLIKKTPERSKILNSLDWFTPEFLVHCQTTHGFSPDIMTEFLEEFYERK